MRIIAQQWAKTNPEAKRKSARLYREKNIEKIREYHKNWIKNHPNKYREYCNRWESKQKGLPSYEKLKESRKQWAKNNPEKIKEYRRKSGIKRYNTVKVRLSKRISSAMRKMLKKQKGGRIWNSLIDFSIEQLKKHLEKQFKPGMTWEKFMNGEIHIDHILPVSAFNFEKPEDIDFQRCWALKNLQPMWAKENISKNNKIEKPLQMGLIFK